MKPRFAIYYWKWGFWVRFNYRMLWVCYDPDYQPLFSERYGYVKIYRLGGFVMKVE